MWYYGHMMDTSAAPTSVRTYPVPAEETDLFFCAYEEPYRDISRRVFDSWKELELEHYGEDVGGAYHVDACEEVDMITEHLWYDYENARAHWGDIMEVMCEEIDR
jgi:hypothetical protein